MDDHRLRRHRPDHRAQLPGRRINPALSPLPPAAPRPTTTTPSSSRGTASITSPDIKISTSWARRGPTRAIPPAPDAGPQPGGRLLLRRGAAGGVAGPWDGCVNAYELSVRNAIYNLGQGGMFRLEIDEDNTSADGKYHTVFHEEIFRTILGESTTRGGDRPPRGKPSRKRQRCVLPRRRRGPLAPIDLGRDRGGHRHRDGRVPDAAFAAGASAPVFNVVTRNLQSAPVIASTLQSSGGWTYRTLPGS